MSKAPEAYAGVGVASLGRGCSPHNNPANYNDVRDKNTIRTFCKVCGGWIGNRPVRQKDSEKSSCTEILAG